MAAFLQELAASYLIITLTATSLAKLRRWRSASIAVAREAVIPVSIAPFAVVGVALAELTLSTLMMLAVRPLLVGCAATILFVLFGGYRLIVTRRTGLVTCSCAGASQSSALTGGAIAAVLLTSASQAAIACWWMFGAKQHGLNSLQLVGIVAWLAPFAGLYVGIRRRADVLSSAADV